MGAVLCVRECENYGKHCRSRAGDENANRGENERMWSAPRAPFTAAGRRKLRGGVF